MEKHESPKNQASTIWNVDDNSQDLSKTIKTVKVVYPQIYSYILPEEPDNEGSQKIGYTERNNVGILIIDQARLHGVSTMKLRSEYE